MVDWSRLTRADLKKIAFPFHYGTYRDAEDAKRTSAYAAACELARRGGYSTPEPHVHKGAM